HFALPNQVVAFYMAGFEHDAGSRGVCPGKLVGFYLGIPGHYSVSPKRSHGTLGVLLHECGETARTEADRIGSGRGATVVGGRNCQAEHTRRKNRCDKASRLHMSPRL